MKIINAALMNVYSLTGSDGFDNMCDSQMQEKLINYVVSDWIVTNTLLDKTFPSTFLLQPCEGRYLPLAL